MNQINCRRHIKRGFLTILLTIFCAMTVWAGTWEPVEKGGYKYKNDDETYLASTWFQENGKWYFFDENGLMVMDSVVEGYTLGTDGAEISGAGAIVSQYPQVVVQATAQQAEGQAAHQASAGGQAVGASKQSGGTQQAAAPKQAASESTAATATTITYVLNKNTKKFHKPSCSSVSDMAAKNRLDSGGSRDEVIAQGYVPCKRCKP